MFQNLRYKIGSLVLLALIAASFLNTPLTHASHCAPAADPVCASGPTHNDKPATQRVKGLLPL